MQNTQEHTRILLSKNNVGAVSYCEACEVVELSIGAISVRIEAEALALLAKLVREAEMRLGCYQLAIAPLSQTVDKDFGFH